LGRIVTLEPERTDAGTHQSFDGRRLVGDVLDRSSRCRFGTVGAKAPNVGKIGRTKITIGSIALVAGGLAAFFALRRPDRGSASLPSDLTNDHPA
jgi:hypothetical protein